MFDPLLWLKNQNKWGAAVWLSAVWIYLHYFILFFLNKIKRKKRRNLWQFLFLFYVLYTNFSVYNFLEIVYIYTTKWHLRYFFKNKIYYHKLKQEHWKIEVKSKWIYYSVNVMPHNNYWLSCCSMRVYRALYVKWKLLYYGEKTREKQQEVHMLQIKNANLDVFLRYTYLPTYLLEGSKK